MIVGHVATGLLVAALAPSYVPVWTMLFGAVLNDVLTGVFVLAGIEHVRSDTANKPLGLTFSYIDYSHSILTIVLWSLAWAAFSSVYASSTPRSNDVATKASNSSVAPTIFFYAFIATALHIVADLLVHGHDMAPYPNAGVKYGFRLWLSVPTEAWAGELILTLVALALTYRKYGNNAVVPALLLVPLQLMNYPAASTNTTYQMGKIFSGQSLRLAVGLGFILTYTIPGIIIARSLEATQPTHKGKVL